MSREERELFELSLYGGAAEERYRRARPEIENLPWGTLPIGDLSERERLAARREWTDAALSEYGSAATFSITLRALLRARVPLDLSAMVARFPLDEIAHAELCARVTGELGGGTPLAYDRGALFPLPDAASENESPVFAAAARVLHEMCVRESWSLAIIKVLARKNRHPLLKAIWSSIANDEAAHAGFGWMFFEWAELTDAERRRLAKRAAQSIADLERALKKAEQIPTERLSRFGIIESIGKSTYLSESRRAIETRIKKPLTRLGLLM